MEPTQREYEVVLTPEAEGGFSVAVPDLPGVYTQGETVEESLEMAKEAIELYLESMAANGKPVRPVQHARVLVEPAVGA